MQSDACRDHGQCQSDQEIECQSDRVEFGDAGNAAAQMKRERKSGAIKSIAATGMRDERCNICHKENGQN